MPDAPGPGPSPSDAALGWDWLGRVAYREAYARQCAAREAVWAGGPGRVLLCEHPPVITLGRSATEANILDARGVDVERIERGGEVTYHGPGQLMIYAIVRIKGVVAFLEAVAGAIIETCAAFDVDGAAWRRDPAGVWLGDAKLAACGIHVSRGVTLHGFAFNLDTPPDAWRMIRPCGLDVPQISLCEARHESTSIERGPSRPLGASEAGAVTPPRAAPRVSIEQVAHDLGPRVVRAVS